MTWNKGQNGISNGDIKCCIHHFVCQTHFIPNSICHFNMLIINKQITIDEIEMKWEFEFITQSNWIYLTEINWLISMWTTVTQLTF